MKARWFVAFRHDPYQAVWDLFTGRAGVGFEMHLDVPELLQQWFPRDMADDRRHLDEAMLWWLGEMQRDYRAVVKRIGFPAYGKRVGDALIALQLLDLPEARSAIRRDLAAWLRWLSPLRLAPERDPALECYELLTQGQPDPRHMAMWLRLAADGRPEYLTVALAGLRRLPNDGDARQNQVLMLQALLRHAVVRFHDADGAHRFFNRRYMAVRGLFPRAPTHWKRVLEDALHGFEHVESPVAKDLAAHLRERQATKGRVTAPRLWPRFLPVPDTEWRTLERDIANSTQATHKLAARLFNILERNHKYALAAGDSYNFVRALSNLGTKLLEHHEPGEADMARFGTMIERGLIWEPANPYCWTLWAEWFRVQGQQEAQEAVLRETLRLFPRNVPAQVELARVLVDRGEGYWTEADYYLDRTTDQNQKNGHAYVVKARLLAYRGKHEEAEKMLAEFLEGNPEDTDVRLALDKHQRGAYVATGAAPRQESNNRPTTDSPELASVSLGEVLRRGDLAGEFNRARIAGHVNGHTQLIKQESQKGDALAGFYSQWLKLTDTPVCPPNAWAWNACLQWQRSFVAHEWEQLAKRFPEAASETHLLRVLAGPVSSNGIVPPYHAYDSFLERPIDAIMRDSQALLLAADLDQGKRDDFACSLMACAAVNPPEFSPIKAQSHSSGHYT